MHDAQNVIRIFKYPILALDLGGKYKNENSQIFLAESETTIYTFKISSKQSLQLCVPHQP